MFKRKTFFVTGCAGFIGSHVAERLLSLGHLVYGMDNLDPFYPREIKEENLSILAAYPNFHFEECSLQDLKDCHWVADGVTFDCIIHLAAKAGVRPSIERPGDYIKSNILGTQAVIDLAEATQCKDILFASSSSIYGNLSTLPFDEEMNVSKPISPYAYTKRANELQLFEAHHRLGLNVCCLRFFTVFGPRQRPDLAICKFIDLIKRGQPITLYGDGSTRRDYTFVDDIVEGVLSAIHFLASGASQYEIINLGGGNPITLSTMADLLYEKLGETPKIEYHPMQEGDVNYTHANITKAYNLLQYEPNVSFSKGLDLYIEWLAQHGKHSNN